MDVQFLANKLPFVKWIRPQACEKAVTYNGGEHRPSWFNISYLPPHVHEFDEVAIGESISFIEQLILVEVQNGIDPKRILLIGFSQGAALCLMTALTTLHDLGGVASLSGWIPHRIRNHIVHNDPLLPIFWAQGKDDTEIPVRYARNSIEFLEQRLCMNEENLRYLEYDEMGHEVTVHVLYDLVDWLTTALCSGSGSPPDSKE
ncbi:alpha/beta-hydrolase [Fomitiporia mediterranea MF3/22]|uniref:alpha/beta-hydrolase n=1 Tax=Fomitiporia mediterranea (strain MF3/22) TaxID=694068 RepID=UPI0004407F1B|nr:alpha/beta-hydrolase [Fomitiporia mediterranea MF3/22]EJD04208.1 alpha/beta-hydrolase [Fomitiporia mediterranea MF3/22]